MYGGALLFIFYKTHLEIIDSMHTFLFLPEKLTLLMESHVWPYLPSFSGFFDTITSATFKFWVKFYHHYSNNTSQTHSRPISHILLAVDEMELNYLRVDFIILFLNGVVSYLVNVMLDHIMVARIHPNPCILTTLYIWLIILTTLYIYIYIYMPNYINNSIYKARKQTATQFFNENDVCRNKR